jgi:hypothetical protein
MRELDRLSLEAIEHVISDSISTVNTIENMPDKANLCDALIVARNVVKRMVYE